MTEPPTFPGINLPRGLPWWFYAAGLIAALIAVFVFLGALGFRFDPFDLTERRADNAEASALAAGDAAAARAIEAEGARDTLNRVDAVHDQLDALAAATAESTAAARSAPDASLPLDPDRLDRLRRSDQRLCELRPAACAS